MNHECAKVLLPLLGAEGRGEGGIAVHGSWKETGLVRARREPLPTSLARTPMSRILLSRGLARIAGRLAAVGNQVQLGAGAGFEFRRRFRAG
jgi:hypothetical protein